jgi:YgiT-type zinc finger domain-containing protein
MTTENASDLENYIAPCPECQTGMLHLQHITYFTWLNDELVTVPNFPAWVCDMCGRREYDSRAIKWLNALLHPETGRHAPKNKHRSPGAEQSPGTDQPTSADPIQP